MFGGDETNEYLHGLIIIYSLLFDISRVEIRIKGQCSLFLVTVLQLTYKVVL